MATKFISLQTKNQLDEYVGEIRDILDGAARAGVIAAINEVRDKVSSGISSSSFNSSSSIHYGIPLIEGLRTYTEKNYPIAVTHILGNTKTNDGTWRLRFFEGGTKPRRQKTTKRFTGSIKANWFFRNAIINAEAEAQTLIDDRLAQAIDKINHT